MVKCLINHICIPIIVDDSVGFVVPRRTGGYVVGQGRSLVHVDWESRKVTKLHEVDQGTKNRFNDGKCDPKGRVWAGNFFLNQDL